jgi:hypothetical protein
MPLGTAHQTRTTGDKWIPEIWQDSTQDFLRKKLVLGNLVMNWNFVGQKGDVIHEPTLSELAANDKVANTQVTLQAPTETEFTMTINKHKECSFVVEDILQIQSKYNNIAKYGKAAGYAIAKIVDFDLWALHATLTTRVGGANGTTPYTGTQEGDLTEVAIRNMIETLENADVPIDNLRLVVPPSQRNALLGIARFTEEQTIGSGSALRTAQFGTLFGATVYVTTMSPTVDTSRKPGLLFDEEAFVLATQLRPRAQSQYKLEYLADLQVIDTLYAVAIYRQTHAIAFYVPV